MWLATRREPSASDLRGRGCHRVHVCTAMHTCTREHAHADPRWARAQCTHTRKPAGPKLPGHTTWAAPLPWRPLVTSPAKKSHHGQAPPGLSRACASPGEMAEIHLELGPVSAEQQKESPPEKRPGFPPPRLGLERTVGTPGQPRCVIRLGCKTLGYPGHPSLVTRDRTSRRHRRALETQPAPAPERPRGSRGTGRPDPQDPNPGGPPIPALGPHDPGPWAHSILAQGPPGSRILTPGSPRSLP